MDPQMIPKRFVKDLFQLDMADRDALPVYVLSSRQLLELTLGK